MAEIDIIIAAEGWHIVPDLENHVAAAAQAALRKVAPRRIARLGLAILLADDAELRRLNATFRGKDKPTNVLSFPAPPPAAARRGGPHFLGDIALALETCLAEAGAEGKAPADHLGHLIVHGILHLLGYDHQTEAEAEAMEQLERAVLARLGIADPYAGAGEGAHA